MYGDCLTPLERKRCKQLDKCESILESARDGIMSSGFTSQIARKLIKIRNYLNREFPDVEKREMFNALVRIGNWCAQDLAENAHLGDPSGNYEKTLNGLCNICRPFMEKARKLRT